MEATTAVGSIFGWLDQHAGAVAAITAMAYTILTLVLLMESRSERRQRREALVEAYPLPHQEGLILELRIQNYGPGVARQVQCDYWFVERGSVVEDSRKQHGAAALVPGARLRALPGLKGPTEDLATLAARGIQLVASWTWVDDGKGRLRAPRTVRREQSWEMTRVKAQSDWLLVEHEVTEELVRIADAAESVKREVSRG